MFDFDPETDDISIDERVNGLLWLENNACGRNIISYLKRNKIHNLIIIIFEGMLGRKLIRLMIEIDQKYSIPQLMMNDIDRNGIDNGFRAKFGSTKQKILNDSYISNPRLTYIHFNTIQQADFLIGNGIPLTENEKIETASNILWHQSIPHPESISAANSYERLLNSNFQKISAVFPNTEKIVEQVQDIIITANKVGVNLCTAPNENGYTDKIKFLCEKEADNYSNDVDINVKNLPTELMNKFSKIINEKAKQQILPIELMNKMIVPNHNTNFNDLQMFKDMIGKYNVIDYESKTNTATIYSPLVDCHDIDFDNKK